MDQIWIRGLRARGKHGVTMQENTFGQEFEVDLTLSMDLSSICKTDDIAESLDKKGLLQAVSRRIEGIEHCDTPEALAQGIVDVCFAFDERIVHVELILQQPQPPIVGDFDYLAVKLVRKREEL